YLRSFIDETRLSGLRVNFDIGHANLADGAEENRVSESFEPVREFVASAHIHDNHGEKDEHLPPYEGDIDWSAAAKLLKTTPDVGAILPLMLELKEKIGPDAPTPQQQLDAARRSLDKLEEAWN